MKQCLEIRTGHPQAGHMQGTDVLYALDTRGHLRSLHVWCAQNIASLTLGMHRDSRAPCFGQGALCIGRAPGHMQAFAWGARECSACLRMGHARGVLCALRAGNYHAACMPGMPGSLA